MRLKERSIKKEDITAFLLTIDVNERKNLIILINSDGTLCRMGSGAYDNTDTELYYGKVKEPLLKNLINEMTHDIFEFQGQYILSLDGTPCRILLKLYNEKEMVIYEFIYGSKFQGLPDEIRNVLAAALSLTEDWYQQQQMLPKAESVSDRNQESL